MQDSSRNEIYHFFYLTIDFLPIRITPRTKFLFKLMDEACIYQFKIDTNRSSTYIPLPSHFHSNFVHTHKTRNRGIKKKIKSTSKLSRGNKIMMNYNHELYPTFDPILEILRAGKVNMNYKNVYPLIKN